MRSAFSLPLAAALALTACAVAGAEPLVELIDSGTLGRACVRDRWAMCHVVVENRGDEPADLDAMVTVDLGLQQVHYAKPVHVPANCRRRVWFPVHMATQRRNWVRLLDSSGAEVAKGEQWTNVLPWRRLLIVSLDDQFVLPTLTLYVTLRDAQARKIIEEEEQEELESSAASAQIEGMVRRTATIGLRVPDFPDHWGGLECMGAVAIGHERHERWRPSQAEALRTWLASGGVLLIFPGRDYDALRNSPVEGLLPVRIFGVRKQKHLTLKDSLNAWEVPLRDYVDVLEVELRDGETLLRDGEFPMVVRKTVGMGAIYFFAFHGSALDQWPERGPFLARVLRGHERIKPFSQSELVNKGPAMLDDVAGADVAPRSFVFVTLGGFFLLAAIALSLAHWRGRTELAWGVIILSGIVIAGISYRAGLSYRKKVGLSLNEIAVIASGSGSNLAYRSGVLGVHAESTTEGQLVADSKNALFTVSARESGEGGQITNSFFRMGSLLRLVGLRIMAGAFPRYGVDSVVDLGGSVVAELQLGPEGISGTISNETPLTLEDCLCVVNSYPYVIGDLAPGQSVSQTLSDDNVKSKDDFTTEAVLGSQSRTRKLITTSLFRTEQERTFAPWAQRLFLLGWPRRDFIVEELQGPDVRDVVRRSIAVLCVEARVRPAQPGTNVFIPRAFSTPGLRPAGSTITFDVAPPLTQTMPMQTDLYFFLPEFASNVELVEADLQISAWALGYNVILSGRDQVSGERVELASWRDLDGRASVVIEDAGRFQDKVRSALVLELRAMPLEAEGGATPGPLKAWVLKETSVALKGVAR